MSMEDLLTETAAMHEPHRVITNPFSGERIVILTSGDETDGQTLGL